MTGPSLPVSWEKYVRWFRLKKSKGFPRRAHQGTQAVVRSVGTASACGAKIMTLANGAGGIKETWSPGQPVLISGHINLTATSPLEEANFVDLTKLYAKKLREVARTIDPKLDEVVYAQNSGGRITILLLKSRWPKLPEGTSPVCPLFLRP